MSNLTKMTITELLDLRDRIDALLKGHQGDRGTQRPQIGKVASAAAISKGNHRAFASKARKPAKPRQFAS